MCIVAVEHQTEDCMKKRLNIILPEETVSLLDRVVKKGNRSRFISDAVIHYVSNRAQANLSERLKQGALNNARRDLEMACQWFSLEEEAWQHKSKRQRR